MKATRMLIPAALVCLSLGWLAGCASVGTKAGEPVDLPIIAQWRGDFPVARLDRLPEGQRSAPVGCIGNAADFAALWQALQPQQSVPEVDFDRHLVVFSRNTAFYNRTSIAKVTLTGGDIAVIAMETLSAQPIEASVAMALAVIPRSGVKFIHTGQARIPVTAKGN